ncbi:hypothetical protein Y032_0355g3346 [Ancylostoma ceylanicum]|nr:hypothetical protein Y032_0355g3346 [Ancylostoma ceylanicum]
MSGLYWDSPTIASTEPQFREFCDGNFQQQQQQLRNKKKRCALEMKFPQMRCSMAFLLVHVSRIFESF